MIFFFQSYELIVARIIDIIESLNERLIKGAES